MSKCALIIPSHSVRHAQISHSDSLNFCYDRKTTFMEEVYRAISNAKHILRSQRRFQMPLLLGDKKCV